MSRIRTFALLTVALLACRTPGPARTSVAASDGSVTARERLVVDSRALGEPRPINVHLPPNYHASNERYPVLYMPDGGMDEDFPHVVATVDSLVALGRIRPVLVVGIPNTKRRRDLTGPTRVAADSAVAPRVGGSAAFRDFITTELIPKIESRYRTTEERAIIGESFAGLFIVETFLATPGLFEHYIALDPSLWWNDGAMADSAARPIARLDAMTRSLFIASSQEPSTAVGSARLDSLLHGASPVGLRWRYVPRPDLTHANIFLTLAPDALLDALR